MKKNARYPSDSTNSEGDIICDVCGQVVDFDDADWQEGEIGVVCGDCVRDSKDRD